MISWKVVISGLWLLLIALTVFHFVREGAADPYVFGLVMGGMSVNNWYQLFRP